MECAVSTLCCLYSEDGGRKLLWNVETFYYQLMHIMLKNTELLKHSKITLQHVSVYVETIFRELQSSEMSVTIL